MNGPRPNRLLRFWIAIGVIIVVALIVAPEVEYGSGELNLTTYSAGPYGARGLFETAERLDWPVQRHMTPFRDTLPANATYLLLDPPIRPGARETSLLLDAVRRGARLLAVPSRGTPLSDSLGIAVAPGFASAGTAVEGLDTPEALTYRGRIDHWLVPADRERTELPGNAQQLLLVRTTREDRPSIVGMKWGAGRIVLVADAGIFANQRQRELEEAVLTVRLIEWLEAGGEKHPIIFSEWHQGRGVHPSPTGVLFEALFETAPGRAVVVLLLAGGVLLLALGARPVAPQPPAMIERRSPFEHVGALSRAYQQIGATRLATMHLVRGLMRRRALGGSPRAARDERAYLFAIRDRHPKLAPQVEMLARALDHRVPPAEFVQIGEAVHTIERTLTQ